MRRRFGGVAAVVGSLVLAVGPGIASASSRGPNAGAVTGAQGGIEPAIIGGLVTLVVGGLVFALGGSYAETVTGKARSELGRSFLVGFVSFLAVLGFVFLGYLTRILLLVAIPLLFVYVLVAIFGTVMAELAIGSGLPGGWVSTLLVAVIVAAFVAGVPVFGGLVGFVVTSIGTGAVINHARDGDGASKLQGAGSAAGSKQNW